MTYRSGVCDDPNRLLTVMATVYDEDIILSYANVLIINKLETG